MKTEQSEFEIAVSKLIEAHCRGEVVDDPKFKHYCKLLNDRLEKVKAMERDLDGFINGPL